MLQNTKAVELFKTEFVESTNTHGAFKQTLVGMFQVPQMILMVDMMVKV
jgi:hypothetical protein